MDSESFNNGQPKWRLNYLEGLDFWEVVEKDYEAAPMPKNPTTTVQPKSRLTKERKTRKSKVIACYFFRNIHKICGS